MKKIILLLTIMFFMSSNIYAEDFVSLPYNSHNGDFNNVKDGTRLELNGYIFPVKENSLDYYIVGTPRKLNTFYIKDSYYSPWLLQNGVYSIGKLGYMNPIGLFYKNEDDALNMKKISVYEKSGFLYSIGVGSDTPSNYNELDKSTLSLIDRGLPIFFNKEIYNQVSKFKDGTFYGYVGYNNTKTNIQLSGTIRDFYDSGSTDTCNSGNVCYYELMPLKEEFIKSAGTCNEMSNEDFIEKFLDVRLHHGIKNYSIKTKIFVADKIIINGKDIMSINVSNSYNNNNKVLDYGSGNTSNLNEKQTNIYNTISNLAISKLKKGKFCEIEKFSEKIEIEKSNLLKNINDSKNKTSLNSYESEKLNNNYKFLNSLGERLRHILKLGNPEAKSKLEYKKSLELKSILDELREEYSDDITLEMLFGDLLQDY